MNSALCAVQFDIVLSGYFEQFHEWCFVCRLLSIIAEIKALFNEHLEEQ